MKRYLVTLIAISAISAGGLAFAQGGGRFHHGDSLAGMTKSLSLTADQQAKVQPILDAAKPQLQAIRQDAMTKSKAVHDSIMSQIRPLLTAQQQAKADQMEKAHTDMANAAKEMQNAKSQ